MPTRTESAGSYEAPDPSAAVFQPANTQPAYDHGQDCTVWYVLLTIGSVVDVWLAPPVGLLEL